VAATNFTVLQLMNKVMNRLREAEFSTATESDYSKLILGFLNDSKRVVEDSHNWDALRDTISITTAAGTSTYSVKNAGASQYTNDRTRILRVYDQTNETYLMKTSWNNIDSWQKYPSGTTQANPGFWAPAGFDSNKDIQIILHQIPNGTYTLDVDVYNPEEDKTSGSQTILVPWEPVMLHTLALAIEERGEDAGAQSNIIFQRYEKSIAEAIAYEQTQQNRGGNNEVTDWHVEGCGW
jgi:hypothetical protein